MKCRACGQIDMVSFADLDTSPPSNAYLNYEDLEVPELWYPLKVFVCKSCFLCQTADYVSSNEVFTEDYAYFSSVSQSWLEHSKRYINQVIGELHLREESFVIEIASNDGYLLQFFSEQKIPCLGIEPTQSTADVAKSKGINTIETFLTLLTAREILGEFAQADLIIGNNVLAHVPDINDFVAAAALMLKDTGTITFEFPHLLELIKHGQFDTIYHEHFSYLSVIALKSIFSRARLDIYKIERLNTHGGSLRVWLQHSITGKHRIDSSVEELVSLEKEFGLMTIKLYEDFQERIYSTKNSLLRFLLDAKKDGMKVVAYGAAAKGNTLLNYAGVRSDLLECIVDQSTAKIGKFAPGSRIPIVKLEEIKLVRPDYILILPWNLKNEILPILEFSREWGCKILSAIPDIQAFL